MHDKNKAFNLYQSYDLCTSVTSYLSYRWPICTLCDILMLLCGKVWRNTYGWIHVGILNVNPKGINYFCKWKRDQPFRVKTNRKSLQGYYPCMMPKPTAYMSPLLERSWFKKHPWFDHNKATVILFM